MSASTQLQRTARELREVAESVDRLARTVDKPLPAKIKLVGLYEAAEITGIPRTTITTMRHRGQLPEPLAELKAGPVWLHSDIVRWARGRAR